MISILVERNCFVLLKQNKSYSLWSGEREEANLPKVRGGGVTAGFLVIKLLHAVSSPTPLN